MYLFRRGPLKRSSSLIRLRSVPYSTRPSRSFVQRPETPPTLTHPPRNQSRSKLDNDGLFHTKSHHFSPDVRVTPISTPSISKPITELSRATPLRQKGDPMPFNCYDFIKRKYLAPSLEQVKSILSEFPEAKEIVHESPILIIGRPVPPKVTPLTVCGLPPVFVPSVSDFMKVPGLSGNPLISDSLPMAKDHWVVLEEIYREFEKYHPMVVGICFRNYIVELFEDVDANSLPVLLREE